ncbi:MAG: hypothetical protein MUE74_12320 [Bacteroidales bacterium]|jgi:hypothetical protein|nr:hypothetical protein [Bacteroidales bacterium]
MQQGNKIILVIGIIAIAAGIFVYSEASSFQKKAVLIEGKVIYVLGSSYRIAFNTEDGTEKVIEGSWKNNRLREGQGRDVWYLPDNPDKARITNGKKGGKKIVLAGVVCILLGVYPLFVRKRETAGRE